MRADSEQSSDTPSTDTINPAANLWLRRDESGRLHEIGPADSTAATSRTAKNAAHVQALAARLGRDAEEMAAKIPEDTLRRLKYPVLAHTNEDGSVSYTRDPGIVEGVISTHSKDLSPEKEKRFDGTTRDSRGRFVK